MFSVFHSIAPLVVDLTGAVQFIQLQFPPPGLSSKEGMQMIEDPSEVSLGNFALRRCCPGNRRVQLAPTPPLLS